MDALNDFLSNTALQYPILLTVFMVIGVLRSIFKPATAMYEAFMRASNPTNAEVEIAKVESSKVYLAFAWLLDYTASIKIPAPASTSTSTPTVSPNGNPKSS